MKSISHNGNAADRPSGSTFPIDAQLASRSGGLPNTGERMLPDASEATTFWEHIYRYKFASTFIFGRDVLDVACGEGYGASALLAAGSTSVIGVDISSEACAHAVTKYGIDARVGSAENIPLGDDSVDVVVSFETIEHVDSPRLFIDECSRVMRPDGTLVISTPNKDVYSANGSHNPFHCSEMTIKEFRELLGSRFSRVELYTQHPTRAHFWSLRSLVARDSAWRSIRGYWRLRRFLGGGAFDTVAAHYRRNPGSAVIERDRMLRNLVNPYLVRPARLGETESALYVIAVARR